MLHLHPSSSQNCIRHRTCHSMGQQHTLPMGQLGVRGRLCLARVRLMRSWGQVWLSGRSARAVLGARLQGVRLNICKAMVHLGSSPRGHCTVSCHHPLMHSCSHRRRCRRHRSLCPLLVVLFHVVSYHATQGIPSHPAQ